VRVVRLRDQKSGVKNETVPLTDAAAAQLRYAPKPREPEMHVWRSPQEDPLDRNRKAWSNVVSQTFSETVENCDAVTEEHTFHDLRAGFATHLASNGLGAHEIRSACRHANVSTSMKYPIFDTPCSRGNRPVYGHKKYINEDNMV